MNLYEIVCGRVLVFADSRLNLVFVFDGLSEIKVFKEINPGNYQEVNSKIFDVILDFSDAILEARHWAEEFHRAKKHMS